MQRASRNFSLSLGGTCEIAGIAAASKFPRCRWCSIHQIREAALDRMGVSISTSPPSNVTRTKMPLHLIKLCVGCDSVKDLKDWVSERIRAAKKKGLPPHHIHITRMTPKRTEELLAGGSLYWVIRGEIAARERLIAIEPFRDRDGIGRCRLVMQPRVIAVSPRPMRAFQGWRYFTEDAAPADLGKRAAASVAAMPEPMRRELRDLGLL